LHCRECRETSAQLEAADRSPLFIEHRSNDEGIGFGHTEYRTILRKICAASKGGLTAAYEI